MSDTRSLTLVVWRKGSGYRISVRMPNPNQPGHLMTLGNLQCAPSQWRLVESLLSAGASAVSTNVMPIGLSVLDGDQHEQKRAS